MRPGVRRFTNIKDALKTGFELSWTQKLPFEAEQRLSAAYTYGQDLERNEPLPEIAPLDLRYAIYGKYLKDRIRPEISFRYVLEQDRVSDEFGETVTPSFTTLSASVSYQMTKYLTLTARADNIFNEVYYEHLNRSTQGQQLRIFAPGRNVSFSASLTL